jgi:hypothetical protein
LGKNSSRELNDGLSLRRTRPLTSVPSCCLNFAAGNLDNRGTGGTVGAECANGNARPDVRRGNTGSVALPITMAIGLDRGLVQPGDRVGMVGIGSGINCLLLTVQWQRTFVRSPREASRMCKMDPALSEVSS